jgi:3-oxosteroid 1-dehydrogenase
MGRSSVFDAAASQKGLVMASADVIVVGAGGAGLMAALAAAKAGAAVILLEKAPRLGGTAAVSGGIVWAPMNDHIAPDDADDRAAALAYFGALEGGDLRPDVLAGFVDHAAAAVRFIEDNSRVRFAPLQGYPDYYIDRPGARPQGGRALDSGLFPYAELGEWRERIAVATAYPVTVAETPLGGATSFPAPEVMAARMARDERGFGQSLVAGLLEACLEAGVEIRLDTRVAALASEGGQIVGVETENAGRIAAHRGVIVTTGGFEWNADLSRCFLKGPLAYPASPPTNTGDGLKMLMAAGAALGNMTSAWWCPTIVTEECWDDGSPRAVPVLIERTLPGSIIINGKGVRFCNEAVNYSAIAGAFHAFDPGQYAYANTPSWLVFDDAYKQRNAVATALPGGDVPAWMVMAPDLAALAGAVGVPGDALMETVARFNGLALAGKDTDFGRGDSSYDRFYGDRSQPGALATLGPLQAGPFYAVPLHMGALGTNGGARTDDAGRVLGHDGAVIAGLYAAGNVMAAPTGGIYAGAGGTLGPALTYGWLAGRAAAAANWGGAR